MNTLPTDLHKFIEYGLGGETFQGFVSRYEEKYNRLEIPGFTFAPTQLGYTFTQLIANVGAVALPTYVDPESPGYEDITRTIEGKTGNIPTMKKFWRLNRVIVREKLQLAQKLNGQIPAALRSEFTNVFMGLLDEGIEGLIQGYYNALTNQRHQIVSTGSFTIDSTNNPRGIKGITISFGVNVETANTGNALWWTNADHSTEGQSSDPIKDMKNEVKKIRRTNHYLGKLRMELSKDLRDDLVGHSKVLSAVGHRLYPAAASDQAAIDYAKNVGDDVIMDVIRRIIGVDSVAVYDSFAYVNAAGTAGNDITQTIIPNFEPKNIAFVPDGKLGEFMGVEPLTTGYDENDVARYHGGRLVLQQRAEPKTHSIYIDSEAAQIAVPSVAQYMFVKTVTA